MSIIREWSKTAANNQAVTGGMAEGQAPSTVNDKVRDQMAGHRTQWEDAEWFDWGFSPKYVSASSFSVSATDVTAILTAGRRVKCYDGGGTVVATVLSASYAGVDTLITIQADSGALTSSLSSFAIGIVTPQSVPAGSQPADQWSLHVTISSNTVNAYLMTADGNTPSAADPVLIRFRSSTSISGSTVLRRVTAATSVQASSGSTLGTANGVPHRVYVFAADDGGTIRLGFYTPWNTTGPTHKPLTENLLRSSTAEGGAGGADSAQVLYTGTAVTSKAIRVLGYFESLQATAGTWASAPDLVGSLPGKALPSGTVVQQHYNAGNYAGTGSTSFVLGMGTTVTPTSRANFITAVGGGKLNYSGAFTGVVSLRDANGSGAVNDSNIVPGVETHFSGHSFWTPGTISATQIGLFFAVSTGGSISASAASVMIQEIFT